MLDPSMCFWGISGQHAVLICIRAFSSLLAALLIEVFGSAHLTPERQQRQSHPQSHPDYRDSHHLGKKLDLYEDTYKSQALTGSSEQAACSSLSC